jgi:hypothetical protein
MSYGRSRLYREERNPFPVVESNPHSSVVQLSLVAMPRLSYSRQYIIISKFHNDCKQRSLRATSCINSICG